MGAQQGTIMNDLVIIGITLAFFALAAGFARFCGAIH